MMIHPATHHSLTASPISNVKSLNLVELAVRNTASQLETGSLLLCLGRESSPDLGSMVSQALPLTKAYPFVPLKPGRQRLVLIDSADG